MKAMRVILVPGRLRLAASLLFLCVPLAAFETVMVTRAPWWRLPYRSMGIWSLAVLFLCLPLAAWLTRGNRWAQRLVTAFFASWLLLNVWVAIRMHNPSLGFFTLFLLAMFGGLLLLLNRELGRSFFDPQLRWFQGLPKPLPGLRCLVVWGDRELDCRVSRLDREGAFVFRDGDSISAPLASLKAGVRSDLTFSFRERTIQCQAMPMLALERDAGAGFQFQDMMPDQRKQLGDFIETLKGEGYVI